RNAALRRHDIDIDVALVLRGESDPFPIGRERGIGLRAHVGRESLDVTTVEIRGPQIPRVDERDLRGGNRGLGEQTRIVDARTGIGCRRSSRQREERRHSENTCEKPHSSYSLTSNPKTTNDIKAALALGT